LSQSRQYWSNWIHDGDDLWGPLTAEIEDEMKDFVARADRTQGIVDQIDYRTDNQDCNLTLEDGESNGRTPFEDDKTLDDRILGDNGGTLDEIDDLQIDGFQIDDGSLWI
jgi:hypothetical protein